MTITLITVCYNSVAVIRTAMESVLRQTWPDLEYLIVDGGSTDGTLDVIREYEPKFNGRMRWVSEPDRGIYDAINKGLALATGDVVGLLNADDVLADDKVLERVAVVFSGSRQGQSAEGEALNHREHGDSERKGSAQVRELGAANCANLANGAGFCSAPDLDAVYGDIRFVAARRGVELDDLRGEQTVRYYSARHWRPWMLQWGFMPPHPSVYIRRACFDRLGGYALDYKIAADYALLIRFLRQARLRARYVPMCFVDMRVGGVSTRNWRSNLLLNQEIVRGNRSAGYFCCLPMLLPKYLFKIWEFIGPRISNSSRRGAKVTEKTGNTDSGGSGPL